VPFLLLSISEFTSSWWSKKGEEISVGSPTYGCIIRYFLYESFFIFACDYLSSLCRVAQKPLDTRDGFFMYYEMSPTSIRHILIINPTRCTNLSNLFCNETLHVSDNSFVHRQEYFTVHTSMVYVMQVFRQLSSSPDDGQRN
jgi:hypothetical protein